MLPLQRFVTAAMFPAAALVLFPIPFLVLAADRGEFEYYTLLQVASGFGNAVLVIAGLSMLLNALITRGRAPRGQGRMAGRFVSWTFLSLWIVILAWAAVAIAAAYVADEALGRTLLTTSGWFGLTVMAISVVGFFGALALKSANPSNVLRLRSDLGVESL
jgi:hypothetical protein